MDILSGQRIIGRAFSTFPAPASGIAGLVLRANDAVFPTPGIDLVCDGTRWRPVNGSAVLAMRVINPITVQNLTEQIAETIGPFPGGLIRAGHALRLETRLGHSGITSSSRSFRALVQGSEFYSISLTQNAAALEGRFALLLDVLSDTSAAHHGSHSSFNSYTAGYPGSFSPTVDFSAPWSIDIALRSTSEAAKTITAATWSGGVATFTATAHTLATGDKTTVAAVTPSGYNGVYIVTVIDANTFTAPIASDPGTYTSGGTSSRVSNMVSYSYVLELKG